jgi:magnesium chelatase family protein
MDRIDVVMRIDRVDPKSLVRRGGRRGDNSETIARRVAESRRFALDHGRENSLISGKELLEACSMTADARRFLENTARNDNLSGRAITRSLRVARTIADLDRSERVHERHVAEALGFRALVVA